MPKFYTVAVPIPLRKCFEYTAPDTLSPPATVGARVVVPYGPQTLVGIVLRIQEKASYPEHKLKPIAQVIDATPILDKETMALCEWVSAYYHHPLGEVLHAALPVALRVAQTISLPSETHWRHTAKGKGLGPSAFKNAHQQRALHQLLLGEVSASRQRLQNLGIPLAAAKALEEKGLIERFCAPPSHASSVMGEPHLEASEEQTDALNQLRYHRYATYLLEGATGSGKTEVYLQAISRVLNEGKQALVLVPEIGLTPQTVARFKRRFNVPVVEMHSNVAKKQRAQNWLLAAQGIAKVVIGTRLSVFTPMPALGMIIIDEEHDGSFKQQDGLRYNARDLAVVRANRANIPLILGSATPSLESLWNAANGRYEHLRLTRRTAGARPPKCLCVDMRKTEKRGALSLEAEQAIEATLARGEQALVFINRRGFAPVLLCEQCGWSANCQACHAQLTLHSKPRHLRCHHCDAKHAVMQQCPECHNRHLSTVGQGTERVEQALAERFGPTPVVRVDQDSMQRKNAMAELVKKITAGGPCILVGTQMLAKGHHFPNLTLVIMLDVDQALFSSDFKALERLGQQVVQVSGRAGREDKPGTVILQSHQADHPLLGRLLNHGYAVYARTLLAERQAAMLPPYWHMVVLRAEAKDAAHAEDFLKHAAAALLQVMTLSPECKLLGPLPALLEKKQDRFRFQLQLSAQHRKPLHNALDAVLPSLAQHKRAREVRWSIDVDPYDLS